MPRKADPKCVYCARNYISEALAKSKNSDCYSGHNCRIKRYRLRHPSQVNSKRRLKNARKLGVTIIDPIKPDGYRVELVIYGKENVSIHAIALDIFQGNKLTHRMLPQHTQGLRQPAVEEYLDKVLDTLGLEYNADCFGLTYWVDILQCPICKLRKEELGIEEKSEKLSYSLPDINDDFFASSGEQLNTILISSALENRYKLEQSGSLIYRTSNHILERVRLIFDSLMRSPVVKGDTKIDNTFIEFLRSRTQQNISTGFLSKYLEPRVRANYERESNTRVESLTPTEALDLFESELLESEVLALAHDENIDAWLERVTRCVQNNRKIDNLGDIVKATDLSLTQVFISLLFSDFQLSQKGKFYDVNNITVQL